MSSHLPVVAPQSKVIRMPQAVSLFVSQNVKKRHRRTSPAPPDLESHCWSEVPESEVSLGPPVWADLEPYSVNHNQRNHHHLQPAGTMLLCLGDLLNTRCSSSSFSQLLSSAWASAPRTDPHSWNQNHRSFILSKHRLIV